MQNSTSAPYVAPMFSPPPYAVAVNALFFASLGIVLVAAFLCMLVKGWIRELDRKLRGIPDLEKRAVIKELREQGLARWWLPEMITILPSLIHISLVLFFTGLALYLLQVHPLPAFLSIAIFGLGVLVYFLSIVISAVDDFSPFRSMYSRALGVLYRRLYPSLMPALISCSALPQTAFEKIRERASTFIIKHHPLSEQAILEPPSSSLKQIISNASVTIFNKLWSPVSKRKTSADAKNISRSILLQLDVSHHRPSLHWVFPLHYESSNLSIKEAEGLAYSVCMMRVMWAEMEFTKAMRAAIDMLWQSSDPQPRLVASLTSVWVECAERELSSRPGSAGTWLEKLSVAGRKEDILHAISNIGEFSMEDWSFVLSSIYSLFILDGGDLDSKEIHALIEILVGLLQTSVYFRYHDPIARTDFWLYVTISVLDKGTLVQGGPPISQLPLYGWILDAKDISAYGTGMTRDPENFRRLLRLFRKHNLDQSLMRQSLISISCILISFEPSDQQQHLRLIDQYLEILADEMGVIDWNHDLLELLNNPTYWTVYLAQTVLCLLKGSCPRVLHVNDTLELIATIMREYDLKLSAANAQPILPILELMEKLIDSPSQITGFELRNPWLSLYTYNLAHAPFHSDIPLTWCPAGIFIASKRLDLYDGGVVALEMNLITFFLSCPSTSIACRVLIWYLRLQEDALTSGDTQHLNATFPTIFRKGFSTDENRVAWLLLLDVLLPSLGSMSLQEKGYFVEVFFGYGSLQRKNQAGEDQSAMPSGAGDENVSDPIEMMTPMAADGLGWMEDVWATVLRSLIIHSHRIKTYWPGLWGVMHATYPESAQCTEQVSTTSLSPRVAQDMAPEGTLSESRAFIGPQTLEEHLEDSARRILEVLAELLESGTGLMPAELLSRIGNSPLLSDSQLHDDAGSLHRIRVILDRGV